VVRRGRERRALRRLRQRRHALPPALGGSGETAAEPYGRAGRRAAASSVAPIATLSGLPASLHRDDHRTRTTSTVPPDPPSRRGAAAPAALAARARRTRSPAATRSAT